MLRRHFLIGLVLLFGFVAPAQAQFRSDRIAVTTTGSGPDVVLVHGLGSSPRVWRGLVQALPGYRYHLVQVKGFAGVPAEGNAGTGPVAAPVAEEIARYIGEVIGRPSAVIGHSMGGTIGMMVAARHPERVSRLMVVDMLPSLGDMFGPGQSPEAVRSIAEQVRAGIADSPAEAYRARNEQTLAGMIATESERPAAIADTMASDRSVSGRSMYELITTDLKPELGRITAPTTVLYVTPTGAPVTDAQMDQYYQLSYRNLAGARLQRVPNARHFIMYDQPDVFVGEARNFLAAPARSGERG
ncbi:alpha/beta hydrolase [Sphingosinicella sp. YJ22]|uniref:alpha/beta fold hydrolase n=1 Tax=Sphingosinicella sp. YJ22 TaxID=1104780 RepID=UPI0014080CB2|nr:alpha/beta hydrolase [Sphingosinicella sp. YJ22]